MKSNIPIFINHIRADPIATCDGKKETPMEIALDRGNDELLTIFAEFTETPDNIKLIQLSKLMQKDGQKTKIKIEFENLLNSLSVELVRVF